MEMGQYSHLISVSLLLFTLYYRACFFFIYIYSTYPEWLLLENDVSHVPVCVWPCPCLHIRMRAF